MPGKTLLLLFFTIVSSFVCAQNVTVAQFKLDESDHSASDEETMQFDQNGEPCAIIKIITTETGFTYDVGSLGITEIDATHPGQVWLYVPYGIKKLTLRHQDYGTCEYPIPVIIEGEKTYRMSLNIDGVASESDSQHLTFSCNPTSAEVTIEGRQIELKDGTYEETLGIGVYSYTVEAEGYIPQSGTFELKSNAPVNMTVTLAKLNAEKENKIDWASQKPVEYIVPGTNIKFTMIPVNPMDFYLGATVGLEYAFEDESPAHVVSVGGFFIGQTEVTQELWEAVLGNNPSRFRGEELPVEQVSWNDCQMFISRLSAIVGQQFRLPTEAEWELAAKGGTTAFTGLYSGDAGLDDLAWYVDNSERTTHTTATKGPNALGIYDMNGNVSEWCQDWYQPYTADYQRNPQGGRFGTHRVHRGGHWLDSHFNCRTTSRDMSTPDVKSATIGLRLAM